jgi:CubicO group peptidase (beta-lactamase class C family)
LAKPTISTDELHAVLRPSLAGWRVAGAAVTLIHGERTWVYASGAARSATDAPVTERTRFPLASLSKSLVAATIAGLVEDGVVGWDRLRALGMALGDARPPVTLRQLLSHSAGLPSYHLLMASGVDRTLADLVRVRAPHLKLLYAPGQRISFSNFGYLAACRFAEEATGLDWRAIWTRTLDGLGLAGRHPTLQPPADDAAPCHALTAQGYVSHQPPAVAAVEQPLYGNYFDAHDMARVLRLFLDGTGARGRLLADGTLRMLRRQWIAVRPGRTFDISGELDMSGYGAGWMVGRYRDAAVLVHGTSFDSLRGLVFVVPEHAFAVSVFITVADDHRRVGACCFRCAVALNLYDLLIHGVRQSRTPDGVGPDATMETPAVRIRGDALGLAGRYRHPGFGEVTIEPSGWFQYGRVTGSLTRSMAGQPLIATDREISVSVHGHGAGAAGLRMEPRVAPFPFVRVNGA